MPVEYKRLIVVFEEVLLPAVKAILLTLDPNAADGIDLVPDSGNSNVARTHLWFGWSLLPHEEPILRRRLAPLNATGRIWIFNSNETGGNNFTPEQVLINRGLQRRSV